MTTSQFKKSGRGALAAASVIAAASTPSAQADQEQFLADIKSGDPQKQLAAWKIADKQEPGVIAPLAKLLDSDDMSVQKTAAQSLMEIVHSVGKEKESAARKAVTNHLLNLLKEDSTVIQTFALRALSLTANADSIPYIAPYMSREDLREEAVFCLERIPDAEADKALINALEKAPEDFKPRIIAALGHRKTEEAAPVIEEYMQSSNLDLAMAAVKAIGRIGVMPETDPPEFDSLNYRQKKILIDSALRFCDAQIQKGKLEFPGRMLVGLLNNDDEEIEEHYICAAIISASKMDFPEAAASIIKQLNRPLYIVRDTAKKTLIAMEGNSVEPALKEALNNAGEETKKTLQEILEKRKA
ncbi:MAG: HEAT repeat domain-containing protein [Candidatus Omnitrophica bacterium]|nr:HEAT repeat domain-containing protein [Candidatus Omnitrophota bacterium]